MKFPILILYCMFTILCAIVLSQKVSKREKDLIDIRVAITNNNEEILNKISYTKSAINNNNEEILNKILHTKSAINNNNNTTRQSMESLYKAVKEKINGAATQSNVKLMDSLYTAIKEKRDDTHKHMKDFNNIEPKSWWNSDFLFLWLLAFVLFISIAQYCIKDLQYSRHERLIKLFVKINNKDEMTDTKHSDLKDKINEVRNSKLSYAEIEAFFEYLQNLK